MIKAKVRNYTQYHCTECENWNPEDGYCRARKKYIHGMESACRLFFWESDTGEYNREIDNWQRNQRKKKDMKPTKGQLDLFGNEVP